MKDLGPDRTATTRFHALLVAILFAPTTAAIESGPTRSPAAAESDSLEAAQVLPVHLASSRAAVGTPDESEVEGPFSPFPVLLEGANPYGFNSTGATLSFRLSGDTFNPDPRSIKLYRKGVPQSATAISVSESVVRVSGTILVDGPNRIALWAEDSRGLPLEVERSLWAGDHVLEVRTEDEHGHALPGVTVRVALEADHRVQFSGVTDAQGILLVSNLPDRMVRLEGWGEEARSGSHAACGSDAVVRLRLYPADIPGNVD